MDDKHKQLKQILDNAILEAFSNMTVEEIKKFFEGCKVSEPFQNH